MQNGVLAGETLTSNLSATSSTLESAKDWGSLVEDDEWRNCAAGEGEYTSTLPKSSDTACLDSWDPMIEDYQSKAFNSYKEPGIVDFMKSFPGNSSPAPQHSTSKTEQGDVRLYISNIPQGLTQEGLKNLFNQAGKIIYFKVIPHRDRDTKIGFVGYGSLHEADAAIQKFNGFDLGHGINLRVKLSVTKERPVFHLDDEQDKDNTLEATSPSSGVENGIDGAVSEMSNITNQDPFRENKRLKTGKPCSFCGRSGFKWCSVCKIPYCSRDCQKNDWAEHKLVCPDEKSADQTTKIPQGTTENTPHDTPMDNGLLVPVSETDQEHATHSHSPPDEKIQQTVPTQYEPLLDENDLDVVDGFDLHNVEMFAETCGIDLGHVKEFEKAVLNSAVSEKSPSSSLHSFAPVDNPRAKPEKQPAAEIVSANQDVGYTKKRESPVPDDDGKKPIRPSTISLSLPTGADSEQPSCARGCKRFFIKQLTMESPPSDAMFDIVVTQVEHPNFFWAQLCTPEALERQEQLRNELQLAYCDSVEQYVPGVGEVCVVQFSFDKLWYRAKVDIVNNKGTLKVTYIDFGNSEDVTFDNVRRIREELIKFPRQALRLCLHGLSSISPSGEWSNDAVCLLKSKILGVKCKIRVCGQHNEILYVQLFDPQDSTSKGTINSILIERGFAQAEGRQVISPHITDQLCSSAIKSVSGPSIGSSSPTSIPTAPLTQHQPNSGGRIPTPPSIDTSEHVYHGPEELKGDAQKGGFDRRSEQTKHGGQGWQQSTSHGRVPQNAYAKQQIGNINSGRSFNTSPGQTRNPPNNPVNKVSSIPRQGESRENRRKSEQFEVIVNAVVNPWEFYVQKTEASLLQQLNLLMQDLNRHMHSNQPPISHLSPGDRCVAKFSVDNIWYRAVVLQQYENDVRVRYIDFGNSEVVPYGSISPLPQQFEYLAPLSLTCSLAGVSKPKGGKWSPQAVELFKSFVANKRLLCSIVYVHDKTGSSVVNILDPDQREEPTLATVLVSAGLAEPFVPKERAPVGAGPRQRSSDGMDHSHWEPSSDNSRESSFTPRSPRSLSSDQPCPVPSIKDKRDRIEFAVFEPAIQAAALPQDGRLEVLLTEIASPGLLFIQNGSVECIQRGYKLTEDMNAHYNTMNYPPFVPRENSVCVAFFAETGDWCRAFIKGISPNMSVFVQYVDFGNSELVPVDRLRPLMENFDSKSYPYSALKCSLANVKPVDSTDWSDEATDYFRTKLPLFSRYSARVVGRRRGVLFLDITTETRESVAQALVDKGLAKRISTAERRGGDSQSLQYPRPAVERTQTNPMHQDYRPSIQTSHPGTDKDVTQSVGQSRRQQGSPLESLVFQPAIQAASLPNDKALIDVMVTEICDTGIFFVQIADRDAAMKLHSLSAEMNASYQSSQPQTSYQPRPHQMCAAYFTGSGDWCRAFIKEVTQDGFIDVYYVDYGNAEKLPASNVRPLEQKLTMYPFFALPCSLANIAQPQPPGWSDQAMEVIKENVPLSSVLSAKLVGRRRGLLFVDFVISLNPVQTLGQFLVSEGLAKRITRSERNEAVVRHGARSDGSSTPERTRPASRQSNSTASSSARLRRLEACVFEPAIQSLASLDSFDAMLTHVSSPSSLFIQVLAHGKVQSMQQLSTEMNAHYRSTSYTAVQAQPNQMCAASYTESGDWCRAFIDDINLDGCVHVHYLDFGNDEVLELSRVRPLEAKFLQLPPMALRCSLAGICPVGSGGWTNDASKALLSRAPLFSCITVKVVRNDSALLFIDATPSSSPDQETLSQSLIRQGHAKGERQLQEPGGAPEEKHGRPIDENLRSVVPGEDKRGSEERTHVSRSQAMHATEERIYASALPLVAVPHDEFFEVFVSEVQDPNRIFFQVLNQENALGLAALSDNLNAHCSEVDVTPYKPVSGELCCAKFSVDNAWYRATVLGVSGSEVSVSFVDYGNEDLVSVACIRRILPAFTQLPFQAQRCCLTGLQPMADSWSQDAVNFLKERMDNQRLLMRVNDSLEDLAVDVFEISSEGQPGTCLNQEIVKRNFARGQNIPGSARIPIRLPDAQEFEVVVTDVVHPGEVWAQAVDADSGHSLHSLMEKINAYDVTAPPLTKPPYPGQECCAQFTMDNTWYRARVLDCPHPGEVLVQYVDFGNREVTTDDRLRVITDEFVQLPAQAVKLSLANVRPTQQAWSPDAVDWLRQVVDRQLKATVAHRSSEQLIVTLEDWAVAGGPVNINKQLVATGLAVSS